MTGDELLDEVIGLVGAGVPVALSTVVESEGSVPRGAGARMAVFEDGTALGTVGGGRLEHEVQLAAAATLESGEPALRWYDHGNTGMVCGGRALVETRRLAREDLPWLESILAEERRSAGRVLLFGGGHVGEALVGVLAGVGFRVTVIDDRPDVAVPELFPAAAHVLLADFSRVSDVTDVSHDDYVVVMTHGHSADLDVVGQVLPACPAYIGCMGSRTKRALFRSKLLGKGFSPEQADSVFLPIGLPIGAVTPEEIAISIAAQLIEVRAAMRDDQPHDCPA